MITVNQQVIVVDRRPVLAPPKTSASVRDVPMPMFVQDSRDALDRAFAQPRKCPQSAPAVR
jgi:hypothetical protein